MENNDNVVLNEKNETVAISERTKRIIKERRKRKKKNSKIRMNFLYKTGFILFVIAIGFLIAAMVICLVEDARNHDSFFAILFSIISAFLGLLGLIFTCVSKEKPYKMRRDKKRRLTNKEITD